MSQNRSNPCRWGKRPKGRFACSLTRWQRRQLSRRATAFKGRINPHPFDLLGYNPLEVALARLLPRL